MVAATTSTEAATTTATTTATTATEAATTTATHFHIWTAVNTSIKSVDSAANVKYALKTIYNNNYVATN